MFKKKLGIIGGENLIQKVNYSNQSGKQGRNESIPNNQLFIGFREQPGTGDYFLIFLHRNAKFVFLKTRLP